MDRFEYHEGRLWCEGISAVELADRYGTPLYVYSQSTFEQHFDRMAQAFAAIDPLICFSIKCCQNIHLCRILNDRGSGFDVVSGGELHRARLAGVDPARIVFAGVGKSDAEIRAAFEAKVGLINIESESELEVVVGLAQADGVRPRVALRVNPDVDPHTHLYTTTGKKETKFGVDIERAADVFARYGHNPHVELCGIHMHIGSPVNDLSAYHNAVRRGLELIERMRAAGFTIDTIDIGGGFGAHYEGSEAPPASEYARVIVPLLQGRGLKVILEPGRSIAANAGLLLSRVVHVKQSGQRRFLIIDASMTELIRPALYGAYHFIWPVEPGRYQPQNRAAQQPFADLVAYDVVGPVCESGDFLAKNRMLPPLSRGDVVAVFTAGAYAMTMASQYNSRPRAAEVLVNERSSQLIRRRETVDDLTACELDLRQ